MRRDVFEPPYGRVYVSFGRGQELSYKILYYFIMCVCFDSIVNQFHYPQISTISEIPASTSNISTFVGFVRNLCFDPMNYTAAMD